MMSKIINFARAQVGKPYMFGRSGPDSFDCSGLTKRACAQIGLELYHGASTQWHRGHQDGTENRYGYWGASGEIKSLPVDSVAFLFNQDDDQYSNVVMAHVGLYDGHGRVIQAGGQYKGVSDKPINKGRWSHWATLSKKWEDRDMAEGDSFLLRRGDVGEKVRQLQSGLLSLGYDLGRMGADGDFGPATEAAVKKFQQDNALSVNGTWDARCEAALDEKLKPPVSGEYVMVPIADINAIIAKLSALVN